MGLFNKQVTSRQGLFGRTAPLSDPLDRQIENAKIRIQDAGFKPQDTDKRNWFEKLTNLPQGQNWFFDTLELLGRPGNAVKNVIDKTFVDKSENLGQALFRGISGKEKVSGSDLAEKMGVENKFGKFLLGTGLDIATDPVTYVPGAVLAKGIKGVAKTAALPAVAGVKALEAALPKVKAARESLQDGFGYAFKPGYKDTETLYGTSDNFLKDLKLDTENQRRFMQENALKDILDNAESTGIEAGKDVGRLMEAPLKQFDDAGNLLERPLRDLPTDPKIQQAAKSLTKSNQMLRQLARDNGIDIREMEGYMTHVWSQAERDFRATNKQFMVDKGRFGTGNPNKKILNERKHLGSAEEVNQRMIEEGFRKEGHQFFEPNAYFASAIGQKRLIDYIQAATFRKKVLTNSDFAVKFEKGMDIPSNAVVIDTNKYTFLKEGGDVLDGVVTETVGGQYVVTKAVKQALDRFQHINTDEGTKAILKTLNGAQSMWKKLALFSPGYHVRNFVGNMWNSYAMGMRPDHIVKYTGEAVDELQKAFRGSESAMFNEFRQQGLLMSGLTKVEMAPFGEPEKAIQKTVEKMSKSGTGKALDKLKSPLNTSRELGESADAVNRYALYKWARDKGQDAKQAAETVRKALFDYADLTPFEQKYMKAFMPFYTWSRKNIPYQLERFINDPQRFQKLNYVRKNAQQNVGLDESTLPDYMKENFYMPLFGKKGKGKMLSLNLPVGDLTKITDPLKLGSDLVSPLIKTPLEEATNYNFFKRKPIKRFEGQKKKFDVFGAKFGIPIQLAYALEQATGQVGRGLSTALQDEANVDQENKFMNPSLGIGSFVKDFDAEKFDYYKKLDELRKLQDFILYIEQQTGDKPRKVNEIKRGR